MAQTTYLIARYCIAQTADILLTMDNVSASFVIGRKSESSIGISARSLGEMNVQLVMEQLNGGGHLTNAACQLENKTIEEATTMLKQAIEETFEGGQSE